MLIIKKPTEEEQLEFVRTLIKRDEREYSRASTSDADLITRFKMFVELEPFALNAIENANCWGRVLSSEEEARFAKYEKTIRACYSVIVNSILPLDEKDIVLRSLKAAMYIGLQARLNPNGVQKKIRRRQSEQGNAAKLEKREALLRAILADAKENNLTLAVSLEFARSIRDDICKRLGTDNAEGSWPSPGTIKSAISTIKRGQNPGF
ncbi:hypothetical protein [Methylocystis sp.]|uniref:hypothetical protein n=1 Tax=Methylocystis sp. TaxID=1911079 RepID=UPI0025D611A2|nr:hypothetical protein [Methylocystis sp.]